jgi:hypothetical protein
MRDAKKQQRVQLRLIICRLRAILCPIDQRLLCSHEWR